MAAPDPAIWRNMLNYLRQNHSEICRQWFEELEPVSLEGGIFRIHVNNSIQQTSLTKQCTQQFNEAAQDATKALVATKFVNDINTHIPTTTTQPAAIPTSKINHSSIYTNVPDQIQLNPDYSFDNFVTGPGNRLASAASLAVAQQPGKAYNPLFIHGGVGLGKTHLLQAVCQNILQLNNSAQICYLSCDSFMNQFLDSVQQGQMSNFRNRYRYVDILVIDDIHFLAGRDRTQEEFFHTFNTLHQSKKQIIISSDSPPDEIPQLEDRLISRFNWGLVTRIDKPCYETRVAILRKKAEIRGIHLPGDVVFYIASKFESNTRELEGAITKVQSLSLLHQTPITLDLTQQAFGDEQQQIKDPHISIQTVIDAVTNYYNVKLADLQSKRRHRSITTPRQVCMYLARKRTTYSLEEIGGYFGGRDHTTVIHAIRTIDKRAKSDNSFASQIDQIDQKIELNTIQPA